MPVSITHINTKKGPFKHLILNIYLYFPLYLNVAQKITILCVLRKGNPPIYEFGRFEMTPEFQTQQTYHVIGNPRKLTNRESGFPADMIECLLISQGLVNKELYAMTTTFYPPINCLKARPLETTLSCKTCCVRPVASCGNRPKIGRARLQGKSCTT